MRNFTCSVNGSPYFVIPATKIHSAVARAALQFKKGRKGQKAPESMIVNCSLLKDNVKPDVVSIEPEISPS